MKRLWLWLLSLVGCAPTVYTHGVPNLAQVDATANIWRGGQPTTAEGWAYIKSLGVQNVVKLNYGLEGSDADAVPLGLHVDVLSMQPEGDRDIWDDVAGTFVRPNPALVSEAIRVLAAGNAYVHCTHGQDRTGLVVGTFRVQRQGWTKDRAWEEMLAHGFHPELVGLDAFWTENVHGS